MFLRVVHLIAAVVWVGSMVFFSLVVMPSLRHAVPPPQRQELIRSLGRRSYIRMEQHWGLARHGPVVGLARGCGMEFRFWTDPQFEVGPSGYDARADRLA
jgi:uncharacterized membrane protein